MAQIVENTVKGIESPEMIFEIENFQSGDLAPAVIEYFYDIGKSQSGKVQCQPESFGIFPQFICEFRRRKPHYGRQLFYISRNFFKHGKIEKFFSDDPGMKFFQFPVDLFEAFFISVRAVAEKFFLFIFQQCPQPLFDEFGGMSRSRTPPRNQKSTEFPVAYRGHFNAVKFIQFLQA